MIYRVTVKVMFYRVIFDFTNAIDALTYMTMTMENFSKIDDDDDVKIKKVSVSMEIINPE